MPSTDEADAEDNLTRKDLRNALLAGLLAGLVLGWLAFESYLHVTANCPAGAFCA